MTSTQRILSTAFRLCPEPLRATSLHVDARAASLCLALLAGCAAPGSHGGSTLPVTRSSASARAPLQRRGAFPPASVSGKPSAGIWQPAGEAPAGGPALRRSLAPEAGSAHRALTSTSRALGRRRLAPPEPQDRPGLGTTFGERLSSRISYTAFVRASELPVGMVAIHYNDRQGLYAMARYLRRTCCRVLPATRMGAAITVRLVDASGRPLGGLQVGGRTIVLGHHGQRYAIEVRNHTGRRWEIVASVDGLDVVDGRPASLRKRGYILPPWGRLVIKGYRTSAWTVAAFRFGSVRNAYATRTTGSSRNVGVVGVAVFAERAEWPSRAEVLRRLRARPFGSSPYARPPE